ncbi:uncharacterized protein LY89DRAFT_691105 [Mollisia scopiformis]|uniref:C2H2-type domain-containing protein n=1 Tax=Mollisia scopiformis TaxID=149040 RepID=A0A132B962_MOLSC|nr:uncharacterized protein LY89DRAFT_691105 [Mollisia scopiformis]KUJ08207.1 hypothetical protein LY89DRAFT_691105 [Mollisia scopiformis]
MSPILCSWEKCGKTFFTNSDLNHHLKSHTKPFHCPQCPPQQATKRLLHRHINGRHFNTEKYY